ncbi:MAG: oxygen-independent coproporphyrinogen III oxidase-like protein [Burkholderiales bacterium]|nr:oxygen-independent coproporphyrinogen III oxidase-like protein [Burkholderiales bacterium]
MSADPAAAYLRPGTLQLPAQPPLTLYVHVPWCIRKCPYCDFNSHALPGAGAPRTAATLPEARYLDALRADLEAALPLVWGRPVASVFIGGGTPSLLAPEAVGRWIADIRALLPLQPDAEITLEANPGTFERDRFRGFRDAGVTRLSIGVQSFDDACLGALGRVHDGAQARAAVAAAAAIFPTFNLDLMYALPGQTPAMLAADLRAALGFDPPHLSVYHLTIEPNTVFARQPPPLPDEDSASAMLDAIVAATEAAGLQRYEVSAFARPGHRCRHNLNYWQFGDYLGIGAGAHGKLSFPHRIVRQVRWREPQRYMDEALAGQAVSNEHEVARAELPFEFMLNALRLKDGFERALFAERTGLPASAIEAGLQQAQARGLLEADLKRIRPTPRGFDFLSDLQALFLPPARRGRG